MYSAESLDLILATVKRFILTEGVTFCPKLGEVVPSKKLLVLRATFNEVGVTFCNSGQSPG